MTEREEWDPERMKELMEESKEEFFELTESLCELMVEFGVRALKIFEAGRGEPLNAVQINQVVVHELEAVCAQISDPEFIQLVVDKAEMEYQT